MLQYISPSDNVLAIANGPYSTISSEPKELIAFTSYYPGKYRIKFEARVSAPGGGRVRIQIGESMVYNEEVTNIAYSPFSAEGEGATLLVPGYPVIIKIIGNSGSISTFYIRNIEICGTLGELPDIIAKVP